MKSGSSLLLIAVLLTSFVCQSQDLNNKVLMTIGNDNVESGKFIRMYKKSLMPGSSVDMEEYLQEYINFKLKVADALKDGYDTTEGFINELKGYRNQLAQSYLTDPLAKEELLRKAYQRSQTEINAWHILVALTQSASPEDTLKAWDKASDIRERIIMGESFEQVARGTSDDQSVKVNGGNLGFITAFQMIMPFEDAIYNLKKGSLSAPVRTPYGYHIIKITDKRPSRGDIRVAHIMKIAPPEVDEEEARQAEKKINDIFSQLQKGVSFRELAKQYSDHKESANNGGELNWFGTGEVISNFSEAAFALSDTGEYTKPLRTIYGWHIIKLLDRRPPPSYEESRSFLESKLNQSYLNSLSRKSLVEKLKNEYQFRINQIALKWFVENTSISVIQGLAKYDRSNTPEGNIYSFANQYLTIDDFANHIEKRGSMILTNDTANFINYSIEALVSDHIISYETSILETKYPEFRYLMKEFHDGILLFEISGKKIWNRISDDSLRLQQYYEDHKYNYLSRRGIEATIYTLKSYNGEKTLSSFYNKYSRKSDKDDRLNLKFNSGKDTLLIIKKGKWFIGDDSEIDNIKWITGSQPLRKDGFASIINIEKIIEPVPLSFNEIQGEMISGYQESLESDWIKQLKITNNVMIDSLVLEEVKTMLNNE